MKIGIVCSRLGGGGGMERLALDLIEGMLDRGIQPVVIARMAEAGLPVLKRLECLRLVKVGLVPGKLRDRYFSWQADRLKKRLGIDTLVSCHRTRNADVIACGGTHPGFLAAMGKKPGLIDRMHVRMEKGQFAAAKVVIAHSQLVRGEIIKYYGTVPERITVLYPAVDGGRFKPVSPDERKALRREFGFAGKKRYFLFPSGDHRRKGLPFLRAFFERTDLPVELLVAGRNAPAGRNVRPIGYVEKIERLYQAADATVLASLYEPFGMVGVESVSCGTPAVFTANMGCCEVVAEPAMLKIGQGREDELEAAVRKIIAFDREAGPDLRECIRYNPTREHHVDELLNLVRRMRDGE